MALHWNIEDVKANYKDDAVWPITNALIWGTMSVGMGEITKKNWQEFYTRCHMIETIHGAWLINPDGKERPITPQDVYEHIGLHTNASQKTKAQLKTAMDRRFREQATHIIKCQPVEQIA